MSFLFVKFRIRSGDICPGVRQKAGMVRLELAGVVPLSWEMRFFAVAKSSMMSVCAASASILSYATTAVATSAVTVGGPICDQRAESSSGSILSNVAVVEPILILFWLGWY